MPVIRKVSDNLLRKVNLPSEISTPSISYFQQQLLQNKIQVQTINSDYTDTNTGNMLYLVNASSGQVTITVKNAQNRIVLIKKIDNTSNSVVIQPESGNIDGQASISITTQYTCYSIICDGTNWWIV